MRPKPTVFIIDDDPAALNSVGALLAAFKYKVRAFSSAEEFLAADVETDQGCLLCDVRLSGMSGLQLLKTLELDGIELPVILISGYADSDMVSDALENGAVAVLEKPIDPNELAAHIQTAISRV
jgi:FixJ family two-component response regulator